MSDLKTKFEMVDRAENAGVDYPGQTEDEYTAIMNAQQVRILQQQCGYRDNSLCLIPYRLVKEGQRRECLGKRCPLIIQEIREGESHG